MRAALAVLALTACAPVQTGADALPPMRDEDAPIDLSVGACRAEPGQRFLGQTATAELGAAALSATGATTLRWAPPGAMLTMDYRRDRLTVAYEGDLVVDRVSCG